MLERLGSNSLVIISQRGGIIFSSREHSLKPLVQALLEGKISGNIVLDKIVGLAAAKLLALGKPKKVFAKIASISAEEFLRKHGIAFESAEVVENIRGKNSEELCMFERLAIELGSRQLLQNLAENFKIGVP